MDEWQKIFVERLVDLGLSHDMAMLIMGKTCDLRQKAYMQGYSHGWTASTNQGKPPCANTMKELSSHNSVKDAICPKCGTVTSGEEQIVLRSCDSCGLTYAVKQRR